MKRFHLRKKKGKDTGVIVRHERVFQRSRAECVRAKEIENWSVREMEDRR